MFFIFRFSSFFIIFSFCGFFNIGCIVFPESACEGFFAKKAAVIIHLHTLTPADLHLHTFTSADLHLHTLTPADLHLHTFTSFFPGSADKAQRLGPGSWINADYTNKDKLSVQTVQKSRLWHKNTNEENDKNGRPANPPARFAFRLASKTAKQQQTGGQSSNNPNKTQCHRGRGGKKPSMPYKILQ